MEHNKDFIEYLKTTVMPGEDGSATFLPIDDFKMTDSANSFGVQISDMIASSIGFMLNNRNRKQKPLVDRIKISKLGSVPTFSINRIVHHQPDPLRKEKFVSAVKMLNGLVAQMQNDDVRLK